MPRLINAEKLVKYKASGVSELTEWQKGWNDAIDTIMNEASTVEAIPIEWIKEWANNYCDWSQEQLIECLLRTWRKETEPGRHGHWIFNPNDAIEMMFTLPKCSECGATSPNGGNYCPNCGVKMDERKEDADFEEPEINPCRGCEDYDGKGGCLSKGGCGERKEDARYNNS